MFEKIKKFFDVLASNQNHPSKKDWTWHGIMKYKSEIEKINFINNCQYIHSLDSRNCTLLNQIIKSEKNLFNLMMEKNPDVNQCDCDGLTPIIFLLQNDDLFEEEKVERLKVLLDRGANINARNLHGSTPIMLSISPQKEIVKTLLQYNPDFSLKNNDGLTVFDIAENLYKQPVEAVYTGADDMPDLQHMSPHRLASFLEVYHMLKVHHEKKIIENGIDLVKNNAKNKYKFL